MCDCEWEDRLADEGFEVVAGVDEVGRGALAGPVLAAAVVLRREDIPEGIKDSKELPRPQREAIAAEIHRRAVSISIARVEHDVIDQINILQATIVAMRDALSRLGLMPHAVLIDALTIPNLAIRQHGIIRGDSKSVSIAAASIVAKVARDQIMRDYHAIYPAYGFDRHVGYGTAAHLQALRSHGPTPIHRITFRGVAKPTEADNDAMESGIGD